MTTKVFSDYGNLAKAFPQLKKDKEGPKAKAIQTYFDNKGLLKVLSSSKEDFTITYPDRKKIKSMRLENASRKEKLAVELKNWKKRHSEAKNEELVLNVKKLGSKKYWEHLAKMASDADYRKDFEKANMETTFAAHPQWNKMFDMFVDSPDYRKRLVETVGSSIVYAKDKTLGKSTKNLREFMLKTSESKIRNLEQKIGALDDFNSALRVIAGLVKA